MSTTKPTQPVPHWRTNLDRLLEALDWIDTLDAELVAIALANCVDMARARSEQLRADEVPWNPWLELLQRMTADLPVRLVWADLSDTSAGNGVVASDLDGEPGYVIVLQESMKHSEWAEVLTHELCHLRRGILFDKSTPPADVDAEEAIVRAMTAELLESMAGER